MTPTLDQVVAQIYQDFELRLTTLQTTLREEMIQHRVLAKSEAEKLDEEVLSKCDAMTGNKTAGVRRDVEHALEKQQAAWDQLEHDLREELKAGLSKAEKPAITHIVNRVMAVLIERMKQPEFARALYTATTPGRR